ncbi:Vacuolar protein sorting [Parasponia andersonii]|uniref:Vacuolar protein sorting n=1 Tax=Parasponia andersonii TaxID=3476 RepID=A0A2P5DXM1_PARAD|nr:Vacuolar protein sorting [Parasponia andersonii]
MSAAKDKTSALYTLARRFLLWPRTRSGLHLKQSTMAMTIEALMYVLVPMPCLFFGGGSTQFLTSRAGGGWIGAAKFLTGASSIGSIAIPIILRHAHMISTGAMFIEFVSFIIFICTVLCFHHASLEDDW